MKNKILPYNIQFFASPAGADGNAPGANGDASGADGANGDDTGTSGATGANGDASGSGDAAGGQGNKTFDDFLKDGHKEEYERRVQEAVETALTQAEEKWKLLTDERLSEAEKLARMTKEEKEKYLQQKHEKELKDREMSITRRELTAEAKITLAEKELPVELAEMLNYTSAETCKASLEALEKGFNKAVEVKVEKRLQGGKPPIKAPNGADAFTREQVEAMSAEEINKNWEAISNSMKTWN